VRREIVFIVGPRYPLLSVRQIGGREERPAVLKSELGMLGLQHFFSAALLIA
jgi:hypothetical protein